MRDFSVGNFNKVGDFMYLHIFIAFLGFASLSCQSQKAQTNINSAEKSLPSMSNASVNTNVSENDESLNELVETFTDDSNIGVPHRNKLEISLIKKSDINMVEAKFYSLGKGGEWKLKQTFEMESGANRCDVQLEDFNNDGFKDMTYVSALAARGANELRRLFIYDKKLNELVYIKNSGNYPNLLYNKALNCIDAQRFYGGNSTDFLRIEGDMLREFARVETFGTERKVYLVDQNGKEKLLRTDKVSEDDLFERYKTFNPPSVYTAEELKQ